MWLEDYIGIWENEAGNKLEIKKMGEKIFSVSFFKADNKPVLREYYNNAVSIDMPATLDYEETCLEVDLWKKGKGFHLQLAPVYNDFIDDPGDYLSVAPTWYMGDDYVRQYLHLFEPFDYYKKISKLTSEESDHHSYKLNKNMPDDKHITTLKVSSGKRTYYVNVKQSGDAGRYLTISENKQNDNGTYERHNVVITEEAIPGIVEALRTALPHFPNYKKPEGKSRMEYTKERFKNAYKPWTEAEDNKLTELFCTGKDVEEISVILQRNIGAINSRIEKLELREKYS